MAKYNSNRQQNLKIGISSYTEDKTVLEITGNAFIDGDLQVVGITTLSGISYPTSDGSANQVLATNGSGTLSFLSISQLQGFDWNIVSDFGSIADSVVDSDNLGEIIDAVVNSYDLGLLVLSGIITPDTFVLPSFTIRYG